nr:RNA-directed DNA polymerase, eukaryota [Tanacetum cinerariifolium]
MSNASMLKRLSCNIFITNFPAYFSSKDLWNTCSKFGTVLDVYILNKDRIVWIDVEGIPFRAWSKTTFNKIARKWGELIFMDDSNGTNKYSLRICVKTTFFHLIVESLKVIIKGKVYVVRAKEVTGWVPDFGEENSDESEDYSDNNSVGKKNWVESKEGEIIPESVQNDAFIDNIAESEHINGDSRENQPEGSFRITCWRPLIVGMVRSLLWEILIRGYSFTWLDKHASKMSKLDRFLVSQGMLDLFPNLTDHFQSVIEDSWNNDGNDLPGDLTKRVNLFHDLKDIDHRDSIDLAQKVKIKWVIEGDENSKKFHGIVNKKRRHLPLK